MAAYGPGDMLYNDGEPTGMEVEALACPQCNAEMEYLGRLS
jgi:hypothetical protein